MLSIDGCVIVCTKRYYRLDNEKLAVDIESRFLIDGVISLFNDVIVHFTDKATDCS